MVFMSTRPTWRNFENFKWRVVVWSLRTVTSCRSDLLTPVTPGLNRMKLNLHHFCRIRNLLSKVFGSRGKLQSRPSLWFHRRICYSSKNPFLSAPKVRKMCHTIPAAGRASQQTYRPVLQLLLLVPRIFTRRDRPLHQDGSPCCPDVCASSFRSPVAMSSQSSGNSKHPSEGKKRQKSLMKEQPATPARNNSLFRKLRQNLCLALKVVATVWWRSCCRHFVRILWATGNEKYLQSGVYLHRLSLAHDQLASAKCATPSTTKSLYWTFLSLLVVLLLVNLVTSAPLPFRLIFVWSKPRRWSYRPERSAPSWSVRPKMAFKLASTHVPHSDVLWRVHHSTREVKKLSRSIGLHGCKPSARSPLDHGRCVSSNGPHQTQDSQACTCPWSVGPRHCEQTRLSEASVSTSCAASARASTPITRRHATNGPTHNSFSADSSLTRA